TGQTSRPRSPFTSELLPCLNSPTTHTTVAGRLRRALAAVARFTRSSRPSDRRTVTSPTTAAPTPLVGAAAAVAVLALPLTGGGLRSRQPLEELVGRRLDRVGGVDRLVELVDRLGSRLRRLHRRRFGHRRCVGGRHLDVVEPGVGVRG